MILVEQNDLLICEAYFLKLDTFRYNRLRIGYLFRDQSKKVSMRCQNSLASSGLHTSRRPRLPFFPGSSVITLRFYYLLSKLLPLMVRQDTLIPYQSNVIRSHRLRLTVELRGTELGRLWREP